MIPDAAPTAFPTGAAGGLPSRTVAVLEAIKHAIPAAMPAWESARRFGELRLAGGSADNASVVNEALAQLGLCRPDVRPPSRALPGPIKAEIGGILTSWGLR